MPAPAACEDGRDSTRAREALQPRVIFCLRFRHSTQRHRRELGYNGAMPRREFFWLVIALIWAWVAGALPCSGQALPSGADDLIIWDRLPPPPLMSGIGDATLKITTISPQAQAYFNQGLRLLHDFWYFEAYRAFKEAARLDPSAGMAYWGMAQALSNFPRMGEQAAAAIEKAKLLASHLSTQEQYYIRATAALLENPTDQGRDAYVRDMQALVEEYPSELNAPALLAFFVMSGFDPDGKPTPGEIYAQTLLRRILETHPENVAANHYWIHAVEGGPDPQRGLRSMAVLLRGAPNSGHIVHMAGHLSYRLGDYEHARKSFLDSLRVDQSYLAKEHIPAQYDDNYPHNLSYLVAACAEAGRRQEALSWARKLDGLPTPVAYSASALNYAIPVGSTTLRLHLRFADFSAAAQDEINFGHSPTGIDAAAKEYQQGLHLYAQGMALVAESPTEPQTREAQQSLDQLQHLVNALVSYVSPAPMAMSGMASHMPGVISYWAGGAAHLMDVSSFELHGVLDCAKGDSAGGFGLLKDAVKKEHALGYTEPPYYARPVEESLGYAYLHAHAWELAREAFHQELQVRPKSGFALYGIARSYQLQGWATEATEAYEQFLTAWQHADEDLPQVRTAKGWVTERTRTYPVSAAH